MNLKISKKEFSSKSITKTKRIFLKAINLSLEKQVVKDDVDSSKEVDCVVENDREFKFRNKMSRFSKIVTIAVITIFLITATVLFVINSGTYFSVWIFSVIGAVLLFATLSFPRNLVIRDESLIINCVLETVVINLSDIKRIHPINRYRMKWTIPLLGSYGFGGFFGRYFDFIHLRNIKMYATDLEKLVYIQTVYHDHYIVSCDNFTLLINKVRETVEKSNQAASLSTVEWNKEDTEE